MSFPFPLSNPSDLLKNGLPAYAESPTHKTYDTMINNISPIPWTQEDSLKLYDILTSLTDFLVPQVHITWNLTSEFASNLDKLLISLKAYYDSSNPVIPKETLYGILIEKNAAETLKRIRIKSIMTKWESTFVEQPDWWDDTPYYQIFDIGDIFYYKYCFFWEEEVNDYLYQLQPVIVNDETVEDFKRATNQVMDELNFNFDYEPTEVLLQPRSSSVIDHKFKNHKDFVLRYKNKVDFRFGKRQPGKRCVIPVHPGGVRDTIINQIPDLNTIMAIDQILSKALRNHHHCIINNVERFQKKLDTFYDNYEFFYCRDIEKEGITKPRYLLKIMLEALINRCPYFGLVCTSDFFDGDWCQLEDELIHSERGHGLGMGNSLTTLMQIILFRLSFNRYAEEHLVGEDFLDFLTLNDDCVFGINLPEDEAFEFSQIDHEILEELGIIRKKTKSFLLRKGFVFLEIYYPSTINRKESINRRTMLLPYSAVNIVHAKDLMSLMTTNLYFEQIIQKWGYEFYPDEVHQPRHFGGWFSKNFYGLDISLDYEITEFSSRMSRAAQAVLDTNKKIRKRIVENNDPFLISSYKGTDSYILNKLPIVGSSYFSSFERLRIRKDFNVLYQKLYNRRQRIFETSKYVDLKTYLIFLRQESDRDIFISSEASRFIRDFEITQSPEGFSDPYRYAFPLSAAYRKIRGIENKYYPSSFWPLTHSDTSFSCSVLKAEMAEMNLDYYAFEYEDEDVVLPTDEQDFQEFLASWKNPVAVGKYCQLRFNKLMIPKIKPLGIEYRQDFFKRLLTLEEYQLLGGTPYRDIVDYLNSGENLQDFFERLEKEREIIPSNPLEDTSSSSDDDDDGYNDPRTVDEIISAVLSKFGGNPFKNIEEILPEGWDLESFENPENIIYVCENQELFDPEVIDYVNSKYDHAVEVYDAYMMFMKYSDPYSLYIEFIRGQKRILDRNTIIRDWIFTQMNEAASKDPGNESSEEVEFQGEFDIF